MNDREKPESSKGFTIEQRASMNQAVLALAEKIAREFYDIFAGTKHPLNPHCDKELAQLALFKNIEHAIISVVHATVSWLATTVIRSGHYRMRQTPEPTEDVFRIIAEKTGADLPMIRVVVARVLVEPEIPMAGSIVGLFNPNAHLIQGWANQYDWSTPTEKGELCILVPLNLALASCGLTWHATKALQRPEPRVPIFLVEIVSPAGVKCYLRFDLDKEVFIDTLPNANVNEWTKAVAQAIRNAP